MRGVARDGEQESALRQRLCAIGTQRQCSVDALAERGITVEELHARKREIRKKIVAVERQRFGRSGARGLERSVAGRGRSSSAYSSTYSIASPAHTGATSACRALTVRKHVERFRVRGPDDSAPVLVVRDEAISQFRRLTERRARASSASKIGPYGRRDRRDVARDLLLQRSSAASMANGSSYAAVQSCAPLPASMRRTAMRACVPLPRMLPVKT